jgi:hypothetical protein
LNKPEFPHEGFAHQQFMSRWRKGANQLIGYAPADFFFFLPMN